MKKLAIISHTEHYLENGKIVGLNSTVTEVIHLAQVFDEIVHIAMLHNEPPPKNTIAYNSNKISFIALPRVGGTNLSDKVGIVLRAPEILGIIRRNLKACDYFQFRAPTGIGVFVIPYLILSRKRGWFKYAGNWNSNNASLSYNFQRFLLKKQKRPVTINGRFINQPSHCESFFNPCLTRIEFERGVEVRANKKMNCNDLEFCFVGRLEKDKGLDILISIFNNLNKDEAQGIKTIHIIGEGDRSYYEQFVKEMNLPFCFHGNLSRGAVHSIFERSCAIILPSKSEGFPKVIAEALNYGCIPIVSNIIAIAQFIENHKNGFIVETNSPSAFSSMLLNFLNLSENEFSVLVSNIDGSLDKFTYQHYNKRIKNLLLP